jgi:hypothetical protein
VKHSGDLKFLTNPDGFEFYEKMAKQFDNFLKL